MQAVIIATKCVPSLRSLVEQGCVAILPLAGKTVIEYAIEALHSAGVREITIVTECEPAMMQRYIGDGLRWGMQFDYAQPIPSDLVQQSGYQYQHDHEETLIVQGDAFWYMDVLAFIEQARLSQENYQVATYHSEAIIKWLSARDVGDGPMDEQQIEQKQIEQKLGAYFLPIDDALSYFQVSTALVNGQLLPLKPSGRLLDKSIYVETGAKMAGFDDKKIAAGFIGRNTQVQKHAQVMGISVLEDNVVVDRGAIVENSIILPNTYIGKMMRVKNSIVNGDVCLNIASGSVMKVDDRLMLAKL